MGLLNLAEELGNVTRACREKRLHALEQTVAAAGLLLTEAQVAALEKKQQDEAAAGEIETAHPGYLGSQDTVYVGTPQGVGQIYQQTFVDTYSKLAFAQLDTTKTPITAVGLPNDRVLPFFAEQALPLLRTPTERGTEYCGKLERHDDPLYLAVTDIEHTKTQARHPQTNGIGERFHKTVRQAFSQVTFRKKRYESIEHLQAALDTWLAPYNNERTQQGKMCCGRTPTATFLDGQQIWQEKLIA